VVLCYVIPVASSSSSSNTFDVTTTLNGKKSGSLSINNSTVFGGAVDVDLDVVGSVVTLLVVL
jgi:hypothetical protein